MKRSSHMKLFVVSAPLGVEHLVCAESTDQAVRVVARYLNCAADGMTARMLASDLDQPSLIRTYYPED